MEGLLLHVDSVEKVRCTYVFDNLMYIEKGKPCCSLMKRLDSENRIFLFKASIITIRYSDFEV